MISVELNYLICGFAEDYPSYCLQLSDFIFPLVEIKESLNHLLALFLILPGLNLPIGAGSSLMISYRLAEGVKDQVNMLLLLICFL